MNRPPTHPTQPRDDDRGSRGVLDSSAILARLALEAHEAHEAESDRDPSADASPERSLAAENAAQHTLWRRLDQETLEQAPLPADRLRARFYRSLAEWTVEAERPSALERFEAWLGELWPRRPLIQLSGALAVLLLGILVGLALDRNDRQVETQLGALRSEMATMNTRAALGLLDGSSAADRLRGVSLSSQALADPRQDGDRLVDELLRIASIDESENVRLAAVEALARVADRPPVRRGLAATLPRQESPVLQVAVADLLAESGGADGERALRRLAADPDLDTAVRDRIYELLAATSGGTL